MKITFYHKNDNEDVIFIFHISNYYIKSTAESNDPLE